MYHKYDDGSQSTWCRFKVFDDAGTEITHGHLDDHTLPKAKEDDKKCNRDVYYAYSISEPYNWIKKEVLQKVFKEHGFSDEDHGTSGFNAYGICANEDYRKSPFEYVGTPKCKIYEVIDMIEEAFCKSLFFNWNDEIEKFKKQLTKRQAKMDEAMAYLEEKHLKKEDHTQDTIESNGEYEAIVKDAYLSGYQKGWNDAEYKKIYDDEDAFKKWNG